MSKCPPGFSARFSSRAEPDRLIAQIEAGHVAEPEIAQQAQIGAGASAGIKHGGVSIQRKPCQLAREKLTAAHEPPVVFLNEGLCGIRSNIHEFAPIASLVGGYRRRS
jgi:hypothetical protein